MLHLISQSQSSSQTAGGKLNCMVTEDQTQLRSTSHWRWWLQRTLTRASSMITKFKLNRESCRNAELIPWVTPWFWYSSTTNSSSVLQKYTASPSKYSLLYFEIHCYLYLSCSWLSCLAEKHSPSTPAGYPNISSPRSNRLNFGMLCLAYCP